IAQIVECAEIGRAAVNGGRAFDFKPGPQTNRPSTISPKIHRSLSDRLSKRVLGTFTSAIRHRFTLKERLQFPSLTPVSRNPSRHWYSTAIGAFAATGSSTGKA